MRREGGGGAVGAVAVGPGYIHVVVTSTAV